VKAIAIEDPYEFQNILPLETRRTVVLNSYSTT